MTRDNQSWALAGVLLLAAVMCLFPDVLPAAAQQESLGTTANNPGNNWLDMGYIAAALAVGLACIASAFAVARIGSAGIGAMSEKPELTGRVLIFLGLAEGIAIYGLIIAIMILNKL